MADSTATQDSCGSDVSNKDIGFVSIQHVGLICKDLELSLQFYSRVLGLHTSNLRPDKFLRFRGAWLVVGDQMIHLLEVPNPDPLSGRPAYVGEDRHVCFYIENLERLKSVLNDAGIQYSQSQSLRPQIFVRDPDGNGLEFQPAHLQAS